MTEPIPNLPLLRKVLDHIDAHPDEWYQQDWGIQPTEYAECTGHDIEALPAPACGTAFCIAGHAAIMSGARPLWRNGKMNDVCTPAGAVVGTGDYAAEVLGLTSDEDVALFDEWNSRETIQRHAEAIAARAGEAL